MHLVHCTMYLAHRALCGALCNVHMKDWDRLGPICHYVSVPENRSVGEKASVETLESDNIIIIINAMIG